MKKIALWLTVLIAAAVMFAATGCRSGSSDGAASDGGLSKIKIWGRNNQITTNGMTTKISDLYSGTVKSRYWDELTGHLAKRGLKLDLTLVMPDQAMTAFQTLLASGKFNDYDWIAAPNLDERTRMSLIDQKRIYPINRAVEEYSGGESKNFYFNTPWGQTFKALETVEDGNFYWVSHNMRSYFRDSSRPMGVAQLGQIRRDWLNKLGLPVPKTLDDFYNALTAFRDNDVNQNGLKDEAASFGSGSFGKGIASWFGLGNSLISYMDYKVVSPWYMPNVKEFFTYMNKLYKAGLLVLSAETTDMASNRLSYVEDYSSAIWNEPNIVVPAGAEKPYYDPFVIDAVPGTAARVYDDELGYTIYRSFVACLIPTVSKNIESTIKFLDYLTSDEYNTLAGFGIEGYSFEFGADGRPARFVNLKDPPPRDIMIQRPDDLWISSIFPGFRMIDRELEYTRLQDFGREYGYDSFRKDFYTSYIDGKWPLIQGNTIEAFPTLGEVERIAVITPDLSTYSTELLTALILGDKSISNWDGYMADLKRLGLDELIGIRQALVDRGRRN
jgi:ABC-type glycerol-3-phosphate transport system substrate-binding protein